MQEKIIWAADSHLGKVVHAWWKGLDEDCATRAILRRCATLTEVTLSDAYQKFYRHLIANQCWPSDAADWQKDKLAAIAALLAHVEAEDPNGLPERMSDKTGDRPLVSELRFRSLLKAETIDDLFTGLRRILPLIKHQTNLMQLARDVYGWNDNTKKQWAYRYVWPAK